jgi:biopolymer transport protein ExbB/TolQ
MMNFEAFVKFALPLIAAVAAFSWFLWQRYQALETRLLGLKQEIVGLRHTLELARQATQAHDDNLTYLTNSNRELIDHRTDRFVEGDKRLHEELSRLEGRLEAEINEVKRFLSNSTEFKVRER